MGQNSVLVCIALVLARPARCFSAGDFCMMSGTYSCGLDTRAVTGHVASNGHQSIKSEMGVKAEPNTRSARLDAAESLGSEPAPGAMVTESEDVFYLLTGAGAATGTGCTLSGRLMNVLRKIRFLRGPHDQGHTQSTIRPGASALPRCEGPVSEGDGLGSASASQPELARASALVSAVGEVSRALCPGFAPGEVSRRGNMSRYTYRTSPSWLADLPTGATLDPPLSCYSKMVRCPLPSSASLAPLGLCALDTKLIGDGFNHNFTFQTGTLTKPRKPDVRWPSLDGVAADLFTFESVCSTGMVVLNLIVDTLWVLAVLGLMSQLGTAKNLVVALTYGVPLVLAVCPGCAGNIASCTYDTDGKCPTIDVPTTNAAVVAGLASVAAGVTLTLTNIISPRFLRMFSRAHLQAVLSLVRRPQPGTIFEIKPDTKLAAILTAVSNGLITMEQATLAMAGFVDDESDADAKKALMEKFKLLTSTKDLKAFSTGSATATDVGVYSWLWGKITNFVADRGMQTAKVDVPTESAHATSVLSTTIKRFTNQVDFYESLNLFIMFSVALGLCTAVPAAEFVEYVVFDTIRMRGKPWQVASELFLVMLRRIEDSGGKLTLQNCINDTHLNTVLDEASATAKKHYPDIFRTHGGKPGNDDVDGGSLRTTPLVKNVTKDTPGAKKCCVFFNTKRDHPRDILTESGVCRAKHVCDAWVKDKGAYGRCLGTHSRLDCTNPNKCDTAVTA